jgi:hypothetical protein
MGFKPPCEPLARAYHQQNHGDQKENDLPSFYQYTMILNICHVGSKRYRTIYIVRIKITNDP